MLLLAFNYFIMGFAFVEALAGLDVQIVIANGINALGVFGLIFGHFLIARSDMVKGFLLSSSGAVLVAIGSALLASWPVVFLNIIWFFIGIVGFFRVKSNSGSAGEKNTTFNMVFMVAYLFLYAFLLIFSVTEGHDFGAWAASGFYISSFIFLSVGFIQARHYLFVCLLGYSMLVPHLLGTHNYAVFANETVGALIGAWGIVRHYHAKKTQSFTDKKMHALEQ